MTESAETLLLRSDRNGVATLTLDRPKARNALSIGMLGALRDAFADLAGDDEVRAVVIAAEGPAFCAGHDLKEMTAFRADPDKGAARFAELFDLCSAVMMAIPALPQPVIAAVEGIATAAGCQLVASCDLAVAGAEARFATPGVQIGLFCSTPMVALSRNLSRKAAMRMLLTADFADADEAKALGLVNDVVSAGGALEAAQTLAAGIATRSAYTVRVGKRAFYEQLEMPLAEAYSHAGRVMTENMLARSAEAGIDAFFAKRAR
ncbi:enoyl-CoA hydratase [Methylobacterium haplocladii]|uniref:Enoyl-CoA hydratase domain-containing protein 3, mitochondrial n=1 Tax=Methylobacterium haplocladii TaxID=1176176 RepID=A0A512IML7_9HYPH|nr:enoyl-CoA hydratase [Methylobacterium haplocladii]GEO98898.1 enoyl-CoA hydratase [Methylobacterium haplocladii]GJD85085.1 putative enoyl-CoA hydratase echA8 [Methylobacterium haplocladii]GLS58113.1 enoyl-CoA hydratase [Methylobacterium haplocladii]